LIFHLAIHQYITTFGIGSNQTEVTVQVNNQGLNIYNLEIFNIKAVYELLNMNDRLFDMTIDETLTVIISSVDPQVNKIATRFT